MAGATIRKEYILHNLGCASCASRIEDAVRRLYGVSEASIVFASKTLTLEIDTDKSGAVFEQAKAIVKGIESDVVIQEKTNEHIHGADISDKALRKSGIRLCISGVLFAAAIILTHFKIARYATVPLYIISYLLSGGTVLTNAGRNILKGRVFDENFLMSVATLGAVAIGFFDEGVAVMLFYQIGMLLQNLAAGRSRRSITALMDIRPDTANLKVGGEVKTVSPQSVHTGDVILVRPGEKVPLDGTVTDGVSMLDTAALTGESTPRGVMPGSEILAGSVNTNGLITVRVTKEFGQSTAAKILDMVQNASAKKAPTENFITTFARYYTPVVTVAALLIALVPPLFLGKPFADWIYRALVFLVISCPCALALSIPLGFFGGIGAASRIGVLVKGSNYLEALRDIDTLVFDKTGTLTKGVFEVAEIQPHGDFDSIDLIRLAAMAEAHSNHPIAVSIRKHYGQEISTDGTDSFEEIAGHGTEAVVGGRRILVGNAKLMNRESVDYKESADTGTTAYVAVDGVFAGIITISDQIKPGIPDMMKRLKESGVKKLVMLTGDSKAAANATAREIGLDAVHSELLPDQKVSIVEDLLKDKPAKGKLAFMGDGVNDAPVLARADVGIAMGGLGSDAAIEAAEVVLMTDEPQKLLGAITVSRKTKNVVWQNIILALGIKAVVLLLGAFGIASMWAAVSADVGVALLAVLNALRILRMKL